MVVRRQMLVLAVAKDSPDFPTEQMEGKRQSNMAWECDLGNGKWDHDWEWISDWYGDPEVIGGTADCSYWRCKVCGEEDHDKPGP